jgi:cytochrome P450
MRELIHLVIVGLDRQASTRTPSKESVLIQGGPRVPDAVVVVRPEQKARLTGSEAWRSMPSPASLETDVEAPVTDVVDCKPRALVDPFPPYARLREEHPCDPWPEIYLISRLARIALETATFGSRAERVRREPDGGALRAFDEVTASDGIHIDSVNGDEHFRRRKIAQQAFRRRKMKGLESLAQQFTDELLEFGEAASVPAEMGSR